MRENNSTWTLPHSFYDLYSIFFFFYWKKEGKSDFAQSCPTHCDSMDCGAYEAPWDFFFFFFCILLPFRQEYWNGLPFPSAGDFPDPGFETGSPALQADTWPYEPQGKTWWASTHQELIKREMLPYKVMTWT